MRPAGYRSPSWDVNVWTPGLLKRHGFLYDSSLMGNDVPYRLDTPAGPLTEIPVQWIMDDAPLFRHVYGATNAIADPGRVLQMWSKEFIGDAPGERLLRADLPPVRERARLPHRAAGGPGDLHAPVPRGVVHHLRGGRALAREPARGRARRADGGYPPGVFAAGGVAPGFGGSVGRTRTGAPLTSESAGSRITASRAWRPATTSTLRP